jgi:hypothetical protein
MNGADPITLMLRELEEADLSCYGMKRDGNKISLFYLDERVDNDRLYPILDKYRDSVVVRHRGGRDTEADLKTCGVNLQNIPTADMTMMEKFGYDIIEIIPKGSYSI